MKLKDLTKITNDIRQKVYERDSFGGHPCCVVCGKPYGIQIAHYIGRGQGGLGIPENLVCLCESCHHSMDNGSDIVQSEKIRQGVRAYLKAYYPDWDEAELKARK